MTRKQDIINTLNIKNYYLSHYPGLKINGEWGQTRCNFNGHQDKNPSLFLNLTNGSYHCKGCGIKGSVFDHYMNTNSVDYKTAFNALAKEVGLSTESQGKIHKTYDYVNETGKLLFQVVRYEPRDFKQRRPDGNSGWIYNIKDVPLVPYNLPAVIKTKSIIIVEGERDADRLNSMGLTASCNPMGAGKWRAEYNTHFKDKKIAIIPDNDDVGNNHAQTVAKNLKGIAESIKIVELPDLPAKGDVSDWIAKGGTKDELIDLIKQCQEWIPEDKKYLISIGDILNQEIEPTKWDIADIMPEGCLVLLSAPPSNYKTWLALDIGRCVSEGLPFLGRDTQIRKVYYIDKENPRAVLKDRFQKLGIKSNHPFYIWPLWGEKEPPSFNNDVYIELAKEKPLIIIDSLIRFYPKGTDENTSTDISPVMAFLRKLTKAGATVLVLHHAGKSDGSDYRGSSDILGGVDIAYTIKKQDNPSTLNLKCIKSRYQMEKDIPIEIISGDASLRFEDATHKIALAKQQEETEKMEAIREIVDEMENPKKTELIKRINAELEISEHKTRDLLKKGEGKMWLSESGDRGAKHYKAVKTTYSDIQNIYRAENLNTSEELPNKKQECIGIDKCNERIFDLKVHPESRELAKWCKRVDNWCGV
jgi:DNA primase